MASSLKLKNIVLVGLFLFFLIIILGSLHLVNFKEGLKDSSDSSDSKSSESSSKSSESSSKTSDLVNLGPSANNQTQQISVSKINAFNKSLIDLQNQFNAMSN